MEPLQWKPLAILSLLLLMHSCESKSCTIRIPGVGVMFRGVDINTFDLMPRGSPPFQQFKGTVIDNGCTNRYKWSRTDTKVFDQPDNIWSIMMIPGGRTDMKTSLSKSMKDVRKSMNREASVSGSGSAFSFSASPSYRLSEVAISKSSKSTSDVNIFQSHSRAQLKPSHSLVLDKWVQKAIDDINVSYEENREPYESFVDDYGTHYIETGYFGGVLRTVMETSTSLTEDFSNEELQVNAEASFMSSLSTKLKFGTTSSKATSSFTKKTSHSAYFYGGDTNILEKGGGWNSWSTTVADNPWLFKAILTPIYELFKDEKKKKNMKIAVEQHMYQSYIRALKRQAKNAIKKFPSIKELKAIDKKIDNEAEKDWLEGDTLLRLQELLDYHLEIPDWFSENTKVCFRGHYPDRKELSVSSCAQLNDQTQAFADFTNSSLTYTNFDWSINTRFNPKWFDSAKLCVEYKTDEKINCLTFPEKKGCYPLGEFSSLFSHHQLEGCKMSFRFKVDIPYSPIPLWAKRVKFCMFYVATSVDTESKQCNLDDKPGGKKNICANFNSWTDYYQRETNDKKGGCSLTWGFIG